MSLLLYFGVSVLLLSILYGSLTTNLIAALAALISWHQLRRPAGVPPGPRGVPILGYMPFIHGHLGQCFNKVAKKYGSIYSLYLRDNMVVVLNDLPSIRKAFVDNGDVFSGRPKGMKLQPGQADSKSLHVNDGPLWREHRRFALATLREYGIGKSSIEPAIQEEIHNFLQAIGDQKGNAFNIANLLTMSVANNICIMEFGKRFEYDDPVFHKLTNAVNTFLQQQSRVVSITEFVRVLKLKLPSQRKTDSVGMARKDIEDFCRDITEEHRKVYQAGSNNDYINAYFTETALREKENNYANLFTSEILNANLSLFVAAGSETTTTTLRWGLLFMMMHPDVQRKVQQEIDDVIGRQRLPSMEDKLRMPYTDATLLEISRRGTIVPMNLPHRCLQDIEINGYLIPKDATVLTNLWAVHHDEKLFPDPFSFRPERFINEEGKFVKNDAIIPFSVGKRFCLGEPLARMELFLYFTSMLQKFTFVNPEGQVLTLDEINGIVHAPVPYTLRAILRED